MLAFLLVAVGCVGCYAHLEATPFWAMRQSSQSFSVTLAGYAVVTVLNKESTALSSTG